MRHSEMHPVRHAHAPASGLALLLLAAAASASAQGLAIGTLRIESTPTGAEVELIGGHAGSTPLSITERDIYPNTYPDERFDLYGVVVLRHPGCEPLRHRLTQGDIATGLHLTLDCANLAGQSSAAPPASSPRASATPMPSATTNPPATAPDESLPQRRLRQLQVLQELLDEGLISATEEQRVRRRILQSEQDPGLRR